MHWGTFKQGNHSLKVKQIIAKKKISPTKLNVTYLYAPARIGGLAHLLWPT